MAATYQVMAPLVVARLEDGTHVHVYEGGTLPKGIDRDQLDQLVTADMVASSEATQDDGDQGDDTIAKFLDRNAADVIADVSGLSAEERTAVAVAEKAGKNRVTVVAALEDAGDGDQGDDDTSPEG